MASKPLSVFLAGWLAVTAFPQAPPPGAPPPIPVQSAQPTPEQLNQLVAPIALYPDSLVAQILAAAAYPDQIVEADRWLQDHRNLTGQALAQAVDQQPWDPSVKALTAFPSVLANMDKNLSWTSTLGDVYINHQADVMNAIQVMRQRAQMAGNLQSGPQETVTNSGGNISIVPANPQVVYVPEFDPWLVYGPGIAPWPGWYWYPGLYLTVPGIAFGVGFGIGFFGGFGWGWGHWGFDWGRRAVLFGGSPWAYRGRTFYNRGEFAREGGFDRGYFRGAPELRGNPSAERPGAVGGLNRGAERPGAFSGFSRGGMSRGFGARGAGSFGGGGFHGGGGGRR
jgi:uncharacterized membrane protein YgcG